MIPLQSQSVSMAKRSQLLNPLLWFDATQNPDLLLRAMNKAYTGVFIEPENLEKLSPILTKRLTTIVDVSRSTSLTEQTFQDRRGMDNFVVASRDAKQLGALALDGFKTAYRAYVDDSDSLHQAIQIGQEHPYVLLSFKDTTNIPLELVIASLQHSNTVLVKETAFMEDALVTLGVMEVGAEGVLFTPHTHQELDEFLSRWSNTRETKLPLSVGEVVGVKPVGMGYRSCIDLATIFSPTEGMLVGSTSQGGLLCCPEVFHLPYMELRPFRVNAGAVHSYVYNVNNHTDYMTELRSGSQVMVVDATGKTRTACVGRIKTEVRPLRLIEVAFDKNYPVNILLQDDWHVRIYSEQIKPLNITEIKPGHKVLGHIAEPGRHVGIKVTEHILET